MPTFLLLLLLLILPSFLLLFFLIKFLLLRRARHNQLLVNSADIQISIQSASVSRYSPRIQSNSPPEFESGAVHSTNTQLQSLSSSISSLEDEENPAYSIKQTQTSSSSASKFDHDVFLSFRGDDTRKSFTDHLYYALNKKGINTFRDDESLRKGEAIKPNLMKAIEGSKFAVVILSKDYASSNWCLDELAYIVKCKEEMKLKVYPVFYDVQPSEVRNQTGNFGNYLAQYASAAEPCFEDGMNLRGYPAALKEIDKVNLKKVKKWRYALREIANVSGWDLHER